MKFRKIEEARQELEAAKTALAESEKEAEYLERRVQHARRIWFLDGQLEEDLIEFGASERVLDRLRVMSQIEPDLEEIMDTNELPRIDYYTRYKVVQVEKFPYKSGDYACDRLMKTIPPTGAWLALHAPRRLAETNFRVAYDVLPYMSGISTHSANYDESTGIVEIQYKNPGDPTQVIATVYLKDMGE